MDLQEFQKKYGIKRINFDEVKSSGYDVEYGTDELICPYCGEEIYFEYTEVDDILNGSPYQCPGCEKWFYASGEVSIHTTCTPIEDKVLDGFTRSCITGTYKHMDECAKCGCQWDSPKGVVEYETYKQYAEPLFENMKK